MDIKIIVFFEVIMIDVVVDMKEQRLLNFQDFGKCSFDRSGLFFDELDRDTFMIFGHPPYFLLITVLISHTFHFPTLHNSKFNGFFIID